ncbi:MAG: hypothetical protein F4Y30_13695 [Chloroflexi bacterium]|nr:hypothetical protein [Chloroflexota bacterium]MCY3583970.1 hypothetical protein [Chloroflexota bacterium]MXX50605.1 hypothetical protein [Chloroflexota bacterium]MYA94451.1 hypothetical protein [Chloroflexota bacterium]MYC54167.1 hypothetical protein [Chloroflexota bacterium]
MRLDKTLMRHDWTLLCTEAQVSDTGAIDLGNVFSTFQVYSPFSELEQVETVLFDPPAVLASHWTAEFENERRVYPATIQLFAPGGDRVLWENESSLDFREQETRLMMYILPSMQFVGSGTYKFHVLLGQYDVFGEWGRAALAISEWKRN